MGFLWYDGWMDRWMFVRSNGLMLGKTDEVVNVSVDGWNVGRLFAFIPFYTLKNWSEKSMKCNLCLSMIWE